MILENALENFALLPTRGIILERMSPQAIEAHFTIPTHSDDHIIALFVGERGKNSTLNC